MFITFGCLVAFVSSGLFARLPLLFHIYALVVIAREATQIRPTLVRRPNLTLPRVPLADDIRFCAASS